MSISSHVRTEENCVEEIRRRALKLGASTVTSNQVAPNRVESVAEFRKAADKKAFDAWIKSRRYACD